MNEDNEYIAKHKARKLIRKMILHDHYFPKISIDDVVENVLVCFEYDNGKLPDVEEEVRKYVEDTYGWSTYDFEDSDLEDNEDED